MFAHQVIAIKPIKTGFEVHNVRFATNAEELKDALFTLAEAYPEMYGDYRFIAMDTLSPITFDVTLRMEGASGGSHASDHWALSFNDFTDKLEDIKARGRVVSVGKSFCRTLASKSGRAGEFLRDFDDALKGSLTDAVLEESDILDSEKHYFEVRLKKGAL